MNQPDLTSPPLQRHGVRASTIALPPGPWLTVLDFLVHRFPQVGRAEWEQRFLEGLVLGIE